MFSFEFIIRSAFFMISFCFSLLTTGIGKDSICDLSNFTELYFLFIKNAATPEFKIANIYFMFSSSIWGINILQLLSESVC